MREWDRFVGIDWSGAKGVRQRGIAVAMCEGGKGAPTLVDPPRGARNWSREDVLHWLLEDMPSGTLAGFDASPAFAFADRDAYFPGWAESPADARALWAMVDTMCAGDAHLGAASFVDHEEASRHFRRPNHPVGNLFEAGRGRLRETERRQLEQGLSPSSCFNLVGAAQVGKSSLTIMRLLNRLQGRLPVWPFDDVPESGSLLVEIYTTIAARKAGVPPGGSKVTKEPALRQALKELDSEPVESLPDYSDHKTDAIITAAWLRRVAKRTELWKPEGLSVPIARTEGWTFGVL